MDWYVKKEDGTVFGPIDLSELKNWAAQGRIAPEDVISTDRKRWRAAYENDELHMDWTFKLDDGGTYGPLHLLAFSDLVEEGMVGFQTPVTNSRHRVTYSLGEVLVPALIKNNAALREYIDTMGESDALVPKEEPIATASRPPESDDSAAEPLAREAQDDDQPGAPRRMRELVGERKKAARWESLYKDEIGKAEQREAELKNQLREMRKSQLALTTELDQVKSELNRQKKMNSEFEHFAAKADQEDEQQEIKSQFKSLLDSYNDISLQYDRLSTQIAEQGKELEELRSAKSSIQKKADKRMNEMSEELQREREDADKARAKLTEAEKNYSDLLMSYREMNDKLVRLRQQMA